MTFEDLHEIAPRLAPPGRGGVARQAKAQADTRGKLEQLERSDADLDQHGAAFDDAIGAKHVPQLGLDDRLDAPAVAAHCRVPTVAGSASSCRAASASSRCSAKSICICKKRVRTR